MSAKNIRIILITMLVTIGALFVTQAYWFKKSFNVHEQQLDNQINIALRSVAHKILFLQNDSTTQIPPISQLASNEFFIQTQSYFSIETLDSLLRYEFSKRGLKVDFDYLIIRSVDDEILLGNSIFLGSNYPQNLVTNEVACKTRMDDKAEYNFKIWVTNKTTYLLGSMGIWMYSSVTLLLILCVFTFIMFSIIKSKKLALLKKDFVNNMTHELKTPIANIAVASDAIRNKDRALNGEKLEKYADIIYQENDRLHQLVDRVLQISSLEKNDSALTLEKLNINDLIKSVTENVEPLLSESSGKIEWDLNAQNPELMADKVHLSTVIFNLIENAIKYSSNHPEIRLTTQNTPKGIAVNVTDKGIGMSKENQDRIFEKFFRAETGNIHNTKGYGLGLSYVKAIIENHKGSVTFKSKLGLGTTFSIFLPQ